MEHGISGTILSSPLFIEVILPFLLVFAVVFAILQKTRVLGDGKKQIDAIVALVIALIAIAFGNVVGIIIELVAFAAIALVVLLVFMLIWGMTFKDGEFDVPKNVKWVIGGLAAIFVIIVLLFVTGGWDYLIEYVFLSEGEGTTLLTNIIFIVVIIVAIGVVVWGGSGGKKKGSDGDK